MATAAAAPFSTDTPSNFFLNCPLLFSAFPHLPFTSPPSSPRPNLLSSTVDRFVRTVSDAFAAAQKPFFQRLLSPFSEARLHAFSQMNAYHWKYLDGVSILVRDFSLKGVISCTGNMIHFRHCGSPNSLSAHNFAAILPGDTVVGVVVANGILNFLNIYNSLLVVRLVLTWFPNSPPAIVSPLSTICDPYLNIFRGIIPPLGGTLDLSPILAFLVLNAFTSAAAALPAELPVSGMPQHLSSSHPQLFSLTRLQKKWVRRVSGKGSKESDESS